MPNEALHWIGVQRPTPPSELKRYAIKADNGLLLYVGVAGLRPDRIASYKMVSNNRDFRQ